MSVLMAFSCHLLRELVVMVLPNVFADLIKRWILYSVGSIDCLCLTNPAPDLGLFVPLLVRQWLSPGPAACGVVGYTSS